MITDIFTIIWKEWKELFAEHSKLGISSLGNLLAIGFLGVVPALQNGKSWVESPLVLIFSVWVPLILVSSVVADAFAGERERHTLETLLASRLSDSSILVGKIMASVSYGWGLTVIMLLISLVTVNTLHWNGKLLIYSPLIGIGGILFSLLGSAVAACAGVLVSLRAPTVKYAQQFLSSASMFIFILLFAAAKAAPIDWLQKSPELIVQNLVVYSATVLSALIILLFLIARKRFRRERLILD
jgi:ABC-2 type transport system permease protein